MLTINKNLKGKKVLDSSKFSTITSSIACSITTFTGVMVMNSITPMFCDDLTKYSDNGAGVISYFAGYGAAYGWILALVLAIVSFFIKEDQPKQKFRGGAIGAAIGWIVCIVINHDPSALKNTIDSIQNAILGS